MVNLVKNHTKNVANLGTYLSIHMIKQSISFNISSLRELRI